MLIDCTANTACVRITPSQSYAMISITFTWLVSSRIFGNASPSFRYLSRWIPANAYWCRFCTLVRCCGTQWEGIFLVFKHFFNMLQTVWWQRPTSKDNFSQSIRGLWKGDLLGCQSDLEEWKVDLCVANLQSDSNPNRTV